MSPKTCRGAPANLSPVKWWSGTRNVNFPPPSVGTAYLESETCRREGLEVSIETSWDVVGAGEGWLRWSASDVRIVVRNVRRSHDVMMQLMSLRHCNFGKRWWAKKSEISTGEPPRCDCRMNDSTPMDRTPSPVAVNGEIIEVRSAVSSLQR